MSGPPPDIQADPKFKQIFERREEAAAAARSAQASYRRMMLTFIVCTAVAAVIGGLVLYGADVGSPALAAGSADLKVFFSSPHIHSALLIGQALSVAAAAFAAYMLNANDYPKIWLENREKAEAGRCVRGREALKIGHAKGPGSFRAAGDYVVADLLEGQIAYFTKAITNEGASTSSMTLWSAVILAVALGAPILASAGLPQLVLFGALAAVVTPALLSGVRSWTEATGAKDRVKLHAATSDLLRDILGRRAEFDAAIAGHDLGAAQAYLDETCAALQTDVKGFLKILGSVTLPPPPAIKSADPKGFPRA